MMANRRIMYDLNYTILTHQAKVRKKIKDACKTVDEIKHQRNTPRWTIFVY
jgi:hypothetical protein